ncbi:hypothetical protein [Amycolatopsis alkalitolerans]|uniref:Uncharacterized protein n=1 Tax=Amycolatopsis alkalitolerans TaxID=2547244 RepID=A0A5C4LV61_9PSEU|nr:hypothetical protein [Amycolatopsis alkalitolerans]TNC22898.1 hypothetical protein FG385_23670 [Amycolatopsis alkalitolerans]
MDVATRRVFRRVVCPVCGERRTEMRVFGTDRDDESGLPKTRRRIRRELREQADAWHPEPVCDRCARR